MASLDLSKLRELELIRQVLIPLFEKMGFKDVDFHHGGVSEKGKDVTMWEPALTGARVNWEVVVKRGKISAAVTGSDSAGTVSTQVRQSFSEPFSDKVTGEDRTVHRCLIVASGAIDKDARKTILSGIDQEHVKNVEFFDGSKLEELVNEHLPQIDAVQQLRNAHASLETSASDYHITTTTTSKGVQISLAPKDPSLTEKLSFKLHLDSSPEGEALKKRLTEFIHAGGSLSIPKAQLQDLVLPKSMEIFGISASSLSDKIEFQQAPREIGEFSLRRICEDGQRASIEHLPLLNIQSGTSRMKLAYNGNNRALELELIVDIISKEATLTFTPKTFGHNAKEVFDAINFAVALSKDGVVEVVQSSTGIVALSAKGTFQPMPQSQELLNLFMRLATIQLKTQTPIVLKQELTLAEHDAITEEYLAVTVGNVPIPTFTGNGTPDQKLSEDRREQMSGRFVMRSPSDYAVTIGQKAINLGPWEIVADNATVVWNEERTKFKIESVGDSLSYINFPRFSGSSEIKEPDQSGTA